MLEADSPMPLMKSFKQDRLQLQRVVSGGVGYAHELGEDEQHEQVVLIAARASHRTSIGREIKLAQERAQPFAERRWFLVGHDPRLPAMGKPSRSAPEGTLKSPRS